MKRMRILIVIAALFCIALAAVVSGGRQETEAGKQLWRRANFMSQKRLYSQLALEGFMMEQRELIIDYGTKMWNSSEDNIWQELFKDESKDQVYKEQAKKFRGNVQAMVAAARQSNLDAAMEAYTRSIQTCYDCHKYVRARERARWLESDIVK